MFISPGLSVQLFDAFSVYSFVQIPVYQNVHGIQQASAFNIQAGISTGINLVR